MKVFKLYFGLPRLHVELLSAQCRQLLAVDSATVTNYFFFWPRDTSDIRESVLTGGDAGDMARRLDAAGLGERFVNFSNETARYRPEIDTWLNHLPENIKFPQENAAREEKFKISLYNVFSQAVARSALARHLLDSVECDAEGLYILTRPDLVLSNNLNLDLMHRIVRENDDFVFTPNSGHHYGGVCDQFMIFSHRFFRVLPLFPEFLCHSLVNGEELRFELLLKRFILSQGFKVCSFDRLAYIFRDGRFIHSGDDGIVTPDLQIPIDFRELTQRIVVSQPPVSTISR